MEDSDRVAEYDMKLMDIDTDALGIPDTDYEARVTMAAGEFGRIVRDLSQLGESVRVEVSKEGVRFSSDGEAANAVVLLKQTEAARQRYAGYGVKKEEGGEAGGSKNRSKQERKKGSVKREEEEEEKEDQDAGDAGDAEEVEEDDGGAPGSDKDSDVEAEQDEENEDEEEGGSSDNKKRKRPSKSNGKKDAKRPKKGQVEGGGDSGGVAIEMSQAVSLTFSLKYLVNFSKSSSLVDTVQLKLHSEVPLLVSFILFSVCAFSNPVLGGISFWSRFYSILPCTQNW